MSPPDPHTAVAAQLARATRVLFITGAGVSAESGIPTFRGSTSAFSNATLDDMPWEEALSATTLRRAPETSWKYFHLLDAALAGKRPNAAHHAIAALQRPGRTVVVATQNIDELHQQAGSADVIELHGSLRRVTCTRCDYAVRPNTFADFRACPRCPECDELLRPDAVLYEESLPGLALERFARELRRGFNVVLSVGTTSVFNYVTAPVIDAVRRGICTVEINPDETPLSADVRYRFPATAGETLSRIVALSADADLSS